MKLSASQAAKQTGKSVPTITRAIRSGKISAEKTDAGGYKIEPSELFRVFEAVTRPNAVETYPLGCETPAEDSDYSAEKHLLEGEIEKLKDALTDAKAERDEWREQAKRLANSLPPPKDHFPAKKRRWWQRKKE